MPQWLKPEAFVALRIIVSALIFLFINVFFIKQKITDYNDLKLLFVCTLFGTLFNMLLFFRGLSYTHRINGAVLMMFTPVFTAIISAFILKENFGFRRISGLILATFGGIFFIGGINLTFNKQTVTGDIMVTLNAILYSIYLVKVKLLMQKYNPLSVSAYMFLIGGVLVLPFGLNQIITTEFNGFTTGIWLGIAFVIVGTTFLTYLLNAWALKHTSPSLVGSYIYLQPVLATIIAVLAQKETLKLEKIIFALLIFAGVYLVNKSKKI
ncbi:MAG: DMT family transporter [Bacteroidetes bacterium]|nr:DMT family transporter [Bacteroidota bacterium]